MKKILIISALLVSIIGSAQIRVGNTDRQKLTRVGDSLFLENSDGVDLSDLSGGGTANEIPTTTTSFDGILSPLDNDVQKALETFDDITAPDILHSYDATVTNVGAELNSLRTGKVNVGAASDEPVINLLIANSQASLDAMTLGVSDVAICKTCKEYDYVQIALSDLTTDLTTGNQKGYWVAPASGTIELPANNGVSIYLLTPGTATGISMAIDKNGANLTTTNITTDATEANSDTATTDYVLSSYTFVRGDRFDFNFDAVPTGAKGAMVTLKLYYD